MTLYKLEFKKVWANKFLIIAFVILFLVNGIQSINLIHRDKKVNSSQYWEAMETVYTSTEGEITSEKLEFAISEHRRLQDIIEGGSYSTEPNQVNTYTGYIFADNNLFRQLYEEMYYTYHYPQFSSSIHQKAVDNIDFFTEKENSYEVNRNQIIISLYEDRNIPRFYRMQGWDEYFDYSFSALLIILMIVLGVAPLFSSERENQMTSILRTCRYGKRKVFGAKVAVAFSYTFVVSLVFNLDDFITFTIGYSLRGFENPLYFISSYQATPFNGTVRHFLAYTFVPKFLGAAAICSIALFSSALSHNDSGSFLGTAALLIPAIILNNKNNPVNYIALLSIQQEFREFQTFNCFGKAVMQAEMFAVCILLLIAIMLLCCYILECRGFRESCIGRRGYFGRMRSK